ncbi:MAG TPA: 4-alpha-glucanotransferase [Thermoanaerobaculia bacterium]|nr:4-alpha-glucanotransferase [Thermoanaerobaculia bacterium]
MSAPEPGPAPAGSPPSRRVAGVLLHPTSLPGAFPVGDLGPAAHALLDWLVQSGLALWQVLPLGPTGYGDSPYTALSAFAGNPLLISPEALAADGLVAPGELEAAKAASPARADLAAARDSKRRLHRLALERFLASPPAELREAWQAFREDPGNRSWLDDWSLFAAIKERLGGLPWQAWEEGLRRRRRADLARARRELAGAVELHAVEQVLFDRQWRALREAADRVGIELVGDVPIYLAADSADVWAHRGLFAVDRDGRPTAVAGVPPDYFSATGQLWGNPLYRWSALRRHGFDWWVERLRHELRRTARVRLDHFRGFVAYWRIPAGARTAEGGRWVPGPGAALFDALRAALGGLPLIAEDLGDVDEPVHALRRDLGLPGMRVLQFGFQDEDSLHAPHRHAPDTVVYTGTHDNDTCRGWFDVADEAVRRRALTYLGASSETLPEAMVRAAFTSVAETAVVPLQDLLGLGSEARMNTPGRDAGNWTWRVDPAAVPPELPARLRELGRVSSREAPRATELAQPTN